MAQRSKTAWVTIPKIRTNSQNHRDVYRAMNLWKKWVLVFLFAGSATIQPVKSVRQSIKLSSALLAAKNIPMANFVEIVLAGGRARFVGYTIMLVLVVVVAGAKPAASNASR